MRYLYIVLLLASGVGAAAFAVLFITVRPDGIALVISAGLVLNLIYLIFHPPGGLWFLAKDRELGDQAGKDSDG
jgi:hypothetical protein